MTTIAERLEGAYAHIAKAAKVAGRDPKTITLLSVSKRKPLADIVAALECGQHAFGENYVQEGVDKIQTLAAQFPQFQPQWHLIGPLQSNKTAVVAEHFDWVQSLDRAKIAKRLNEQRPAHLKPIQICIQVNISGEESKSGVKPDEVLSLAQTVAQMDNLTLRGLMAIGSTDATPAVQQSEFQAMKKLFDTLKSQHPQLDTLSMGMSGDLEIAIMEGTTMVRLGTAIFGARTN
ncbi:YggS family pyridoxal phosphate-dependent enzyme [Gallaecimonas mangrovi]|uniref:YggS family pyridoxal phosphate-dependent enzyme n=1 Tax=Gallaecimonas mangrovi TaxID=2291597 RepID=UPI000E1FC5B2|nr:YggS family pyridoxal phosphate-dependent enzyme [Gallaecimonas mangrovi]